MSFSPEWLALREPVDLAARDPELLGLAAAQLSDGKLVLDLGSGTGSTARAFAAHGFADLRWRFFDNDPALMAIAEQQVQHAECVVGNLADVDALPLDGVGLVTASALLDLMPQDWVDALADRLWQAKIPFYAALSYDGVMRWTPAMDDDDRVTEYFNAHQCMDKGIGPALGPTSGAQAAESMRTRGFDVRLAESPWIIGAMQAEMHAELLTGIGAAAGEAGMIGAEDWTRAHREMVETSQAVIGHTDLLALPS